MSRLLSPARRSLRLRETALSQAPHHDRPLWIKELAEVGGAFLCVGIAVLTFACIMGIILLTVLVAGG